MKITKKHVTKYDMRKVLNFILIKSNLRKKFGSKIRSANG